MGAHRRTLRSVFAVLDANGNGTVSLEEYTKVVKVGILVANAPEGFRYRCALEGEKEAFHENKNKGRARKRKEETKKQKLGPWENWKGAFRKHKKETRAQLSLS